MSLFSPFGFIKKNTLSIPVTPTPTPTPSYTPTNTLTPSVTPSITPTNTPSITPTNTPTPTPSQYSFTPNSLTGLTFWTDFSDNSFYTTSGSSIIDVYSKVNNSTTHTLNKVNSSNNNYTLVNSLSNTGITAAKVVTRPTNYIASSWNTVNDNAIVFGPKTNTTSYPDGTIFVVLNRGTISYPGYVLSRAGYNGSTLVDQGVIYNLNTGTTNTNMISYDNTYPSYLYYNTTSSANVILTRVNNGPNATIYNGSTQQGTGTKNVTQDRTFRQFSSLGAFGNPVLASDSPPENTYYCEVIIYNRILSDSEKTQVWNYLSTKWNISL